MVRITALMENTAGREELAVEHGLSLLVECRGRRVLFDCGQGPLFLQNARQLGISLEKLDAVVLSHSHYDHAGGYRALVEAGLGGGVLYTGPGFFEPKHSARDGQLLDRSCGFGREFPRRHGICHREVRDTKQIFPGMWLLTGFPRSTAFETVPEKFLRKTEAGFLPDDFRDEICLALEVEGGLALVVGCAHPGIVNMVMEAASRLGRTVRGVFGGTHLAGAPSLRLERTLEALAEAGVERLGFSHCSGEDAIRLAEADRRFRCCRLAAGDRVCPGSERTSCQGGAIVVK